MIAYNVAFRSSLSVIGWFYCVSTKTEDIPVAADMNMDGSGEAIQRESSTTAAFGDELMGTWRAGRGWKVL